MQQKALLRRCSLKKTGHGVRGMQLMSIEDLAEYLGDSKRTIYKYIKEGSCPPYIRINSKNIKFDKADVDRWLESKKVRPQQAAENKGVEP
jgi:excisionase family DNA binding protein